MSPQRAVFFVSDGTGITAETLGQTLLTQFDSVQFSTTTLPFINSPERARQNECRPKQNHVRNAREIVEERRHQE